MLCLPSMLLSPLIRFGGKSMLFAKIAVSKCFNRLGLVQEWSGLCIFVRLMIAHQIPMRFRFRVHCNLIKQLFLNSIPEFVNVVQKTLSVKLIDNSNWNHNDRKIVFLTDGSARRERGDQYLPAGRGNGVLLRNITQQYQYWWAPDNKHPFRSKAALQEKLVCYLLLMGLEGLSDLLHYPAPNQDDSPA